MSALDSPSSSSSPPLLGVARVLLREDVSDVVVQWRHTFPWYSSTASPLGPLTSKPASGYSQPHRKIQVHGLRNRRQFLGSASMFCSIFPTLPPSSSILDLRRIPVARRAKITRAILIYLPLNPLRNPYPQRQSLSRPPAILATAGNAPCPSPTAPITARHAVDVS